MQLTNIHGPVFLIGFMGSGKTTTGKKMAVFLNYEFIDLDKKIENAQGITIAQYFEKYGEQSFRELERDTLQSSQFPEKSIIACGGATPCFFDNMEWMNKAGITVYLYLPPKILAQRLNNSQKDKRPMIRHIHDDEMLHFIAEKLQVREVFYKQAKYTVNSLKLTAEQLIHQIGRQLK